jgi:late competence protein required for DNA uptake (superfamily II DNA/RNA helicase)
MIETRRIVSITPIDVQPAPKIEVNDRRKRCVHCSNTATNDVIFKQEGATIIERYCDSCLVSLKLKK